MFKGILTLILIIAFVLLCVWVYSPSQKKRFKDASLLPFDDETNKAEKTDKTSQPNHDRED